MSITVRDQVGVPANFVPEKCPDLTSEPFSSGPWLERCDGWGVDQERTSALSRSDVDVEIHINPPKSVWEGSVTGMPYQLVGSSVTTVWDLARPITWNWFTPTMPTVQVPLPPVVRREGDPGGAWDRHAYLLDPGKVLWEMIQLDYSPMNRWRTWWQCDWTVGYDGGGHGVARWDLTKPWNAKGQPGGVVAANIPHMPHFIRYDELNRGEIKHAMFMALGNYSPEVTGYARASDGSAKQHPCRGGERLRLPLDAVKRFAEGTAERVVAEAMNRYGIVVGDRSDWGGSATGKAGSIAVAQDTRITAIWRGMNLRLSDLEVVRL